MGRKKIENREYIDKMRDRLKDLATAYIEKKNADISRLNEQIAGDNKKARERWKMKMLPVADCPQKDLLHKYTIQKLLDDISSQYDIEINYKQYNSYINGSFPDDPRVLQAFAKMFGVSFEYIYGLSDIENEVTAELQTLLPISDNAINTLRNILKENKNDKNSQTHEDAIKVLEAILSDPEDCILQLTNVYQRQYQIYKSKVLHGLSDYDLQRSRIIYAELFANFIENNLLKTEAETFESMLKNDIDNELYYIDHPEDISE